MIVPATSDLSTTACIDAKPRMKLSVSPPSVSRGNNGLASRPRVTSRVARAPSPLHGCSSVRRGEWVVGLCVVTFCRRGEVLFFVSPEYSLTWSKWCFVGLKMALLKGAIVGIRASDSVTEGRTAFRLLSYSTESRLLGTWGTSVSPSWWAGGAERDRNVSVSPS